MTARQRAVAALIVVQILFGALPVAAKLAIPVYGAGGVATARILSGMLAFHIVRLLLRLPPVPWSDQPRIILCAMLGIAANQLLFLEGLAHTSAIHATLIITLIPVLTAFAARVLGYEVLEGRRLLGMMVGVTGVLVLFADSLGSGALWGDLLVLLNGIAYAFYLVLSRDLLGRNSPIAVLAWLFTWAAPVALLTVGLPPLVGPPEAAYALLFIVLGPTLGTYWLNLMALRELPASQVASFILIQPVITAVLAVPLLGDRLGPYVIVASVLTSLGVWLATRQAAPRR